MIVLRFPGVDRVLTCCKCQSESSNLLVIHLKFAFYSIDKVKSNERKFSEILLEKSSLKTLEFKDDESGLKNFSHTKSFFWDDNKGPNIEHQYQKNEIFEIYPIQVLNHMIGLIDNFYRIIYNKNNLITFIENPECNINEILANCFSYSVNFDITDILAIRDNRTITFDFICNKINETLQDFFNPITGNYYCNDRINVEINNPINDNDEALSIKKDPIIELKDFIIQRNLKAKDLFIMELLIVEQSQEETITNLIIYNKEHFSETIKKINKKIINNETIINLRINVFFLPEIEDIFTELTKEELPVENSEIITIETNKSSQYYYNDNNISKIIPSYVKYHNEDYFITISKKQKSYLHSVINSLTSLQAIVQLEALRFSYNMGNKKIDFIKVYDMLNKINSKYIRSIRMNFKVTNRFEIVNYIGLEEEVYSINNLTGSDRFNYLFNFECFSEAIYKDFVGFCLVSLDNNIFIEGVYSIPLWLMFSINITNNRDDSKRRKLSIDEKDNEIFVDVRYIDETFFNHSVDRDSLQKRVRDMMEYYIKSIDKKVANDV
jgi:hypothetical protein